jgi:HEAT repeat protein
MTEKLKPEGALMLSLMCQPFLALAFFLAGAGLAPSDQERDLNFLTRYLTQSSNPKVRAQCARDLEKLGSAAKPAARALCRALLDSSESVRTAADSALEKIDSQLYWPVRALVSRPDESKHARAIAALCKMKENARPAVPILLFHLSVSVLEFRLSSADAVQKQLAALVRLERTRIRESDPIETILEKILDQVITQKNADVEAEGLEHLKERQSRLPRLIHLDMKALAEIAGDEKIVLRSLGDVSRSPEVAFRRDAVAIFEDLGAANPKLRAQIVLLLMPRTRDVSLDIRLLAVRTLGTYGKDATRAIPALRRLKTKDPSEEVRQAAAQALEKIDHQGGV